MYLNCNIRPYKNKMFPDPESSSVSQEIDPQYRYAIDISSLCTEEDSPENILNDVIFDNTEWGTYYPRYEVVDDGETVRLVPYDFKAIEVPAKERRHKIEAYIAQNVRLQTELKGIRKALSYLVTKLGEQDAEAVQDFIKNEAYIRAQIARIPKEEK